MSALPGLLTVDLPLVEPASLTCARAFADDPSTLYLIPDKSKQANLRYAFELPLRMAAMGGAEAYTTSIKCEGVAIWVPSGQKQSLIMSLRAGFPFLLLRCGWQYLAGEIRTIAYCEKIKKKLAPRRHCYLALLAVDPQYQNKGYASVLLNPMLKRLDEQRIACYLETQNMKNAAIYQHFGFKLVYETKMPGTDFPLYAMLREA